MYAFHLFRVEIRLEMEGGKLYSVLRHRLSAKPVERDDSISHSYFLDVSLTS